MACNAKMIPCAVLYADKLDWGLDLPNVAEWHYQAACRIVMSLANVKQVWAYNYFWRRLEFTRVINKIDRVNENENSIAWRAMHSQLYTPMMLTRRLFWSRWRFGTIALMAPACRWTSNGLAARKKTGCFPPRR